MRLINDDCLVAMDKMIEEGVKVDMVLADPPYGMSFQCGTRKDKYDKIKNDCNLEWLDEFARLSYEIAKDNTAHYVFCSFHHIDKFKQAFEKYFKVKNILTWSKRCGGLGDLKADFMPTTEFVLFLQKGRKFYNGKRVSNVLEFNKIRAEYHPTQKPLDLIEFMLEKFTNEGEVVIDPFMGSGTTGVACKNLGRDFIGIELDDKYFNIAKNRINETNI